MDVFCWSPVWLCRVGALGPALPALSPTGCPDSAWSLCQGLCQDWGHSTRAVPPRPKQAAGRAEAQGSYFCFPAEGFCVALLLPQKQIWAAELTGRISEH